MDLYRILNISRSASIEEIKKSYRKLAKMYHPDLFKINKVNDKTIAENHFKTISNAYQILSNIETKAEYDRSIGNWHHAFDGRSNNNKSTCNSKTYTTSSNSNTSASFIHRDHYNVQAWYDHYYGNTESNKKHANNEAMNSPFVSYPGETKHQQYYRRKHIREQQDQQRSNLKSPWNADVAYEIYKNNGKYDDNVTRKNTNDNKNPAYKYDYGDNFDEQIRIITDNLRNRRNERINNKGSNNNGSSAKSHSNNSSTEAFCIVS